MSVFTYMCRFILWNPLFISFHHLVEKNWHTVGIETHHVYIAGYMHQDVRCINTFYGASAPHIRCDRLVRCLHWMVDYISHHENTHSPCSLMRDFRCQRHIISFCLIMWLPYQTQCLLNPLSRCRLSSSTVSAVVMLSQPSDMKVKLL